MLKGACCCRSVTYEVADEFDYAGYCHCKTCQARTGSAFSSFAGIAAEKLKITSGEALLRTFGDPDGTYTRFCSRCGTTLLAGFAAGRLNVQMGTLIDTPSVRPREHIFVGRNAPWHEIADSLPQYAGHRT
jgi:hypothetical protein